MTPAITVPAPPPLVTIHGVELIRTGTWPISTGLWTVTREDLQSAVAALDCPAVHRPGIKIGHTDNRFTDPHADGDPLLGYVDNLVSADDWNTLIGDYVGVPAWLGAVDADGNSVISSAYPHRSIEGFHDFRCQIGHTHPFVLTAVALLGATHPGVGTLQSLPDLMALYGVVASSDARGVRVSARMGGIAATTATAGTKGMVALLPTAADATRLSATGGLGAAELHLTLLFLGAAVDWDDTQRAALIEAIRPLADGVVEGDGFAVAMFNPDTPDACVVELVGGQPVADLRTAVLDAVPDGSPVPEQRQPWIPHVTLRYTADPAAVTELADRPGPIVFDRIRIRFADTTTDIPLTATTQAAAPGERSTMPNPTPTKVAAGVTTEDVRREYYDDAGWDSWITEFHLDPLQLIVCDDRTGKHYRIPVTLTGDDTFEFGERTEVLVRYIDAATDKTVSASADDKRLVYASRAESRPGKRPRATEPAEPTEPVVVQPAEPDGEPVTSPPIPAEPSAPADVPAAEPDNPTTQEDDMSLSGIRARLGLADDADEKAILAALDARLQPTEPGDDDTDTNAPPEPTPVQVADSEPVAAGISPEYAAELKRLSGELAAIKAEKADNAKRRLFDDAIKAGKINPADRGTWEGRYDKAPEVIGDVLASIAPGAAVPVQAAGHTGVEDTDGDMDGLNTDVIAGWADQLGISAEELSRG